jgi:very-short-patch-repair endonuclease
MNARRVFNTIQTKTKRIVLRKNQTDAEKKLWARLRNKQFYGYKIFRQYGVGQYIADFYCPRLKLVIEVDGS